MSSRLRTSLAFIAFATSVLYAHSIINSEATFAHPVTGASVNSERNIRKINTLKSAAEAHLGQGLVANGTIAPPKPVSEVVIGTRNPQQDRLPTDVVLRRAAYVSRDVRQVSIQLRDWGACSPDGDAVDVEVVEQSTGYVKQYYYSGYLNNYYSNYTVQLRNGVYQIRLLYVSEGACSPDTAAISINTSQIAYGNSEYKFSIYPGTNGLVRSKFVQLEISRSKYPQSASHIDTAQNGGRDRLLTFEKDVSAKNSRRKKSINPPNYNGPRGVKDKYDLDEYPPACFKENYGTASVQRIGASDNRGSGATFGNTLRSFQYVTDDVAELVTIP
ncbi:NucA/NucB deoxyribonuclease domain-containing protein [Gloeobacter kilaueensis]|uniref:Competence-specific nuclease n=1 Tax=Gloeobacter kilaueensis (strain ATCC BAA-2537 / CCAP 1431/1 / ULC 316 / JS1) TaxID=1183438 RepID=U5QD76_GLOK1|nr:NucA/NucB deoxyribonuclease domain-containing protein [Gloeobacter kilaueensis]AGY56867.1 competence-specific nuclease [Gloeobacter kilaueensis JS1]